MGIAHPYHLSYRRKWLTGLTLTVLIIGYSTAETSCKKGCTQSDKSVLQYAPGHVYEYNFESIMTVGMSSGPGGETDDTGLKVSGTAKVFAEGNCGFTLQLGGVKVLTTTDSKIDKKLTHNMQKPVHFTLVNGKLEPEICADSADNEYALNIKRGVISLLQANTEDDLETDVFGKCPTHTSVSKTGNAEIITKVRNLNSCAYHENLNSGIVTGVVNEKAGIKSTMLLEADYAKELKLEHGIVTNAQLVEEYKFAGSPKSGIVLRAKVTTSLSVKNPAGSTAAAPASGNNAVSIIFQKPEVHAVKNIGALKTALNIAVNHVSDYVQRGSAKQFVELIHLMRNSDVDTLLELSGISHPKQELARQVYYDALFRVGTSESAKAILKQLNKMNNKEKSIAMLSLNLVKAVDKDTLNLAAGLVNPNVHQSVFLSVGKLVAKYCQDHNCESGEVEQLLKKFNDALKHCKANTRKEEDKIVHILKGFGNMNYLDKNSIATLLECASVGHANRIRVAALQAFSSSPCQQQLQSKALDLLRNTNEDSELRIEAYLAAVGCPTAEVADVIADVVNKEPVYQVGGFITSHLKVIRDSADATREQQRLLLGHIEVSKTFPRDYRRYSFNNEISYKMDALGVSGSSDYKLIYSQQGFLPRSARINISTEVFGTNFNVFEANIRQENLEDILEYYVGPKGLLNQDFDETVKMIQGNVGGGRTRRSIADESTKFAKKYKTYGNKGSRDLNLDLSLKLFGSEMMFLSLGDHIPSTVDDLIQHFSVGFEEVKKELSSFNKEFNMHSLFLDTNLAYTTGVGIPLELSVQGFAANKVDVGVNLDIDKILEQNWQRSKYRLKIVPSVDVHIKAQCGFNAYVMSTGMRLDSSMHSATGSDVHFELQNDANGFNMDIELPREKMELIDVHVATDFYVAEQDKPTKSVPLKAAKAHKNAPTEMCFNQLEAVGFGVCVSTTLPEKPNPSSKSLIAGTLAHPFEFNVHVTSERKFNLKGFHIQEQQAQKWKLAYSTPGSRESHDTSLALELATKPRTYGRISFDNPQLHLAVEAGVNNDDRELVIYAQYEKDTDVRKNRIGFVKSGNEYIPVIEIQDASGTVRDINGYHANGKVVVQKTGEKSARYNFQNFQIVNKQNEGVAVNGFADVGPASLSTELNVTPGSKSFFVKSDLKIDNGEYTIGMFINDDKTPEDVYGGSVQLKAASPQYAVKLVGKAYKWEINGEHELQYTAPEGSYELTSTTFNNQVTVKHQNNIAVSGKLKGHVEGQKKVQFSAELTREKKQGSLNFNFIRGQKTQEDYALEVNGKYNQHFVDLMSKCDFNGNHYILDNSLSTSWGLIYTVKGELGQRYTLQDIHINLQGTAQHNNKDKPIQWTTKVIGTPEKTISDIKLSRENADLIKISGEVQHPQDKISAGKLNLAIKNIANCKADFKVSKNGKGELKATLETLKTEPKSKVDIDAKFLIQSPKYEIEATAKFNNEKKFLLKTESNLEKLKFFTKNMVEVDDKKISLDANGMVKGDWRLNGELQGNFVFTCPDGRMIDGSLKRKFNTNPKSGLVQGNVEGHLSDKAPNGTKQHAIDVSGKVEKMNWKEKEFSVNYLVAYTDQEGKQVDANCHVKHLPKGQHKMLDVGVILRGNTFKQPIDVTIILDEYSAKLGSGRVTGRYGDKAIVSLNGKYQYDESAASYEIQSNLQVPQTTYKTIELTSNGKYGSHGAAEDKFHTWELHVDEKSGDGHFVKLNTNWDLSGKRGQYSFDLHTKEMSAPLRFEGSHQSDLQGQGTESQSLREKRFFSVTYGEKFFKVNGEMSYASQDSLSYHVSLDSSLANVKDIEVDFNGKKIEGEGYSVTVNAKHAGHVHTADTTFYVSPKKKGIDLRINQPNEPPIVIVYIFEGLTSLRKATITVEITNLMGLDLKANSDLSYKSVNEFSIWAHWNSDKLNLNDYDLDVRSQGETIRFILKNAEGKIVEGSAAYALQKEANKIIIDGKGQLNYKGQPYNSNFKLTRQMYDLATDKEVGFSYTVNGNFGPKNAVLTFKATSNDFLVQLSICEEKKQCTNVQWQSAVIINDDSTQHSLLVLIDLRELGYPYEFELRSKTNKQLWKVAYNLDSKLVSNNNLKYQVVANILPNSSKVQLKLPTREILFESQQQYPEPGKLFGHYENSAVFYFDKARKPNEATRLGATLDITGVENSVMNTKGEIKFEHPNIRTLSISGNIDANRQQRFLSSEIVFDIFRTPDQRIIVHNDMSNSKSEKGFNITSLHTIRSIGFDFQYEISSFAALDIERQEFSAAINGHCPITDMKVGANMLSRKDFVEFEVVALNEKLAHIVGAYNRQKHTTKLDARFHLLSQTPLEITAEAQTTMGKITFKREGLFEANGDFKLGKEIKLKVEGNGKQLFNGRVALDNNNFLQTTYKKSDENIEVFMKTLENAVKKDSDAAAHKLEVKYQKIRQTLGDKLHLLKDNMPELSNLKQEYQTNIKEILKELETDPALKEFTDKMRKILEPLAKLVEALAKNLTDFYQDISQSLASLYEKFEVLIKESIIPAWKDLLVKVYKLISNLQIELVNAGAKLTNLIAELAEKYGPALADYGKIINDTLKPFAEAMEEFYKIAAQVLNELEGEVQEFIAKLPKFEVIHQKLSDKFSELKLPEKLLEFVNAMFEQLHILPQTAETSEFLQKAQKYLESKIKKEHVDDTKLIEELLKLLSKAVKSVWTNFNWDGVNEWSKFLSGGFSAYFTSTSEVLNVFSKLPNLFTFRFSVVNFILNEKWDQIFTKDLVKSWIFFHDFNLNGHLVDGKHVITFDGQYFTFPGNCKYILAQDSVDTNFTVIGQLNNGKLKSIVLVDRDGNFLEVNDAGALKLNGNNVEHPQHDGNMHAWRLFYTVYLKSEYGVQVMCTTDLKVCHVDVSGFYTSKTRGLMGNGNAEPYDDLVQVDGTQAKNFAQLGNDYGMGKCNPVPESAPPAPTEICQEIFGLQSNLAMGYLTIEVEPYREACNAAVQTAGEKDRESLACTIALAYGSALRQKHHPVMLPSQCLKCVGAVGQRDIGQEFIVKLPTNKADLVFVVDFDVTPTVLSQLIAPAVTDIREVMKARGFTDVQTSVIAFNESLRYPALLTSDNGKLNFQGSLESVQLGGPKSSPCDNCIGQVVNDKKVITLVEKLEQLIKNIVPQSDEMAYYMALRYPFRAGAMKSIIGVRSHSYDYKNWARVMRAFTADAISEHDGAILHLIGPVDKLAVEGVPADKLVGFNSRLVATLDGKDAKKRQKLYFQPDVGVDLVLNSGGWVFATDSFDKLKAGDQKKVLNQVTSSIADTLFKTEIISDCKCVTVQGLHAQHKCSIKSMNFIPNKKVKTTK